MLSLHPRLKYAIIVLRAVHCKKVQHSGREGPRMAVEFRREAMERLVTVVQELSLARDVAAVMAIVCHAAHVLTGADGASFVLREGDMCYYADEEASAPLWKGQRFPMSA